MSNPLVRGGALALAALLAAAPAEAQSPEGAARARAVAAKAQKAKGGKAAPARVVRRQPVQPRRQQQPSFFASMFGDFDDDDDRPRRGQRQQQSLNAAPVPLGPPVIDGGGRPAISPAAPPTVAYSGPQSAGTVVIDTRSRSLYYVLGGGRAYRYGVAVGREGFGWTGTQRVSRVAAWPDWRPPQEMRERDPRLPELMTGGIRNPLGAKAIYLGSTLYRIHGTNDARSIGSASSSGCFRMTNSAVTHLAKLVRPGTTVQVVNGIGQRPRPGVNPDAATMARMAAERRT